MLVMPIYLCRNLTINNIKQKCIVCTVMKIQMIQAQQAKLYKSKFNFEMK